MKLSTKIGLKYSALGFVSFVLTAFLLGRVLDEKISAGFGVGIWVWMIMRGSEEAYRQGQLDQRHST